MSDSRSIVSYEAGEERTLLLSDANDKSTEITNLSTVKRKATNNERTADGTTPSNSNNTSTVKQASKSRMAVTLASCCYLTLSSSAIHISLGIIYVELIAFFDSQRADAALVQSMFGGVSVGGGILFTNLVLKYEIGLVIMLASLTTAASFCASAFAPNIEVVIILIGVIAGLANSISLLSSYIVVSWMFQERRKAAMVVLLMGPAVGQIVLPYVTAVLVERLFWSDTVIIIGALMFLNNIPCGLVIYFSRDYFQMGDDSKRKSSRLVDVNCLTDVAFMLFLFSYTFLSILISVVSLFIADMSKLKGFSAEASATFLSVNGLSLFLSRVIGLVWLALAPDTKLVWHLIYIFLALAVSHIIVSQFGEYWIMLLGIMLRGLSGGLIYAFLPGVQIDMRGLELFPQTVSICNFLGGVASIAGGYLGGLSYDLTGSYSVIFFAATGTNVFNAVSMVVIIIIHKYRRKRSDGYDKL